jgi:hypothetical protein
MVLSLASRLHRRVCLVSRVALDLRKSVSQASIQLLESMFQTQVYWYEVFTQAPNDEALTLMMLSH